MPPPIDRSSLGPPDVPPGRRRSRRPARSVLGRAAGAGLLATGLACLGNRDGVAGRSGGTPASSLDVQPRASLVVVGGTARFLSVLPGDGRTLWSVVPAGAGNIDAEGLFTPSGSLGDCLVVATWSRDARVTGSAEVTVVAANQPVTSTPDLAAAAGGEQTGAGGVLANHLVLGESLAAATASAEAGGVSLQVRHGFFPDPGSDGP